MEQRKEARKRTRRRGSQERPTHSKPLTLRELGGKTVWDWLQLIGVLAIPVVLGIGGCMFNAQQDDRQLRSENQRANTERKIAEQRADDAVLQAYLDQISLLMLKEGLNTAKVDSKVSLLARARTLTVLSQLEASPSEDNTGKEQVMEFLIEAELVHGKNGEDPVISLEETDLRGVDLDREDLHSVDLKNAVMHDANLEGANLEDADLEQAKLTRANLREANLYRADLTNVHWDGAKLGSATMPNGQKYEDWIKDRENSEKEGEQE